MSIYACTHMNCIIYLIRFRGEVQVYDFSKDQLTQGVPDICLSTFDEPSASNYNMALVNPYDKIWTYMLSIHLSQKQL